MKEIGKMIRYGACMFSMLLPLSGVAAEAPAKVFPAKGLRMIQIRVESGDIQVQQGVGDVTVGILNNDSKQCDLTTEAGNNDMLMLKAKKRSGWFSKSRDCSAGFKVNIPGRIVLDASSGAGAISVMKLERAALVLNTGSGDVRVKDCSGSLMARSGSGRIEGTGTWDTAYAMTGSGSVSLEGLTGYSDVKTGSGDVKLAWSQAPKKAEVNIKTGNGSVLLLFPKGTRLKAQMLSGEGRAVNEFRNAGKADVQVSVMTGSGDISIKRKGASGK